MNGAGKSDGFEEAAIRMIGRQGDGDTYGETNDAAGHVLAHVFLHADTHADEGQILLFGFDADDGGHAGGQGGSNEVGGRKRFAPAVVVDRGVRV